MQYQSVTSDVILAAMAKPKDSHARHNNLRALMARDGVTATDIAKAWGVELGDVSQRINCKVGVTPDRARKLTKKFGWTASEIYGDLTFSITIVGSAKMMGNICLVDGVNFIPDNSAPDSWRIVVESGVRLIQVKSPLWTLPGTLAFKVGDNSDSRLPLGSLVCINENNIKSGAALEKFIGTPCVVKSKDGNIHHGKLHKGSGGKYNIHPSIGSMIEDISIEWAAPEIGTIQAFFIQ